MEEEKKKAEAGKLRGRSRRQQTVPGKKKILFRTVGAVAAALVLAAGAGTGYYFIQAGRYETAFLPNTKINGMDVSGKTADAVKAAIENSLSGYALKVVAREYPEEVITKEEIGLHAEFDGSLEEMINAQNPRDWIKCLGTSSSHEIGTMIVFDEEKLQEKIAGLACMNPETMREPENATVSEYQSDTKSYQVTPEDPGTELIAANVEKAVRDAVMNLETEVDLEAHDCYTKPAVKEDDEGLLALVSELNTYVGAAVTHTFGEASQVLDGDTIHTWLSVEDRTVVLDESQVAAYVKELAGNYDTAYKPKTLKTSYGDTVTISRGNYGWRINQSAETAAVTAIVKAGEKQTREPEYIQKGASHGENDYGNTYVEVNLTAQHLFFYKNGELVVESDFVSGNEVRGWATPAGAYPLTYKQRNAVLKGENYRTPVSYWMPFNGGIGLHDAAWRGSFGGSIYKTSGSHGCVNLPPGVAKTIYEGISAGDPVLCYHLSGTESKKSSKPAASGAAATTAAPAETTTPAAAEPTAATSGVAPEETAPIGPSVEIPSGEPGGPSAAQNPAEESSPQETPVSPAETSPTESQTPESSTAPSVTAGGDKESFGPGFVDPVPEETQMEIGPGM